MKSLLLVAALLIMSCQISLGQIDYDKRLYQRKVEKFKKLKKTGTVLMIAGGAMTVGGVALISSADWYTDTNAYGQTNTTTDDPNGVLGLVGVLVGVPMTAGGIVLAVIGAKKEKQYQHKLDNLSAGYFQRYGAHGLTLRLRL